MFLRVIIKNEIHEIKAFTKSKEGRSVYATATVLAEVSFTK
jgi:hypothetical protein